MATLLKKEKECYFKYAMIFSENKEMKEAFFKD